MSDIKKIKDDYIDKLNTENNIEKVNNIKSELFGKNGIISNEFKKLASISVEERKKLASDLNNIKKIDAVLWTHAHADHANGIDDLRQFLWTRKEQLPVYGSKDTINALKTRFDYVFSQDNSYFKPPLKVNTINEGEFSVCSTKVFAFNQHHGKEFTYGYKVDRFAYSTDVKSFPKSSEKYLYDLDLWVIDCVRHEPHYSHSHFDQTIQWIKKFKPKKAILTHLGAWLDYDDLKKLCPNNVEPGYDGLTQYLT